MPPFAQAGLPPPHRMRQMEQNMTGRKRPSPDQSSTLSTAATDVSLHSAFPSESFTPRPDELRTGLTPRPIPDDSGGLSTGFTPRPFAEGGLTPRHDAELTSFTPRTLPEIEGFTPRFALPSEPNQGPMDSTGLTPRPPPEMGLGSTGFTPRPPPEEGGDIGATGFTPRPPAENGERTPRGTDDYPDTGTPRIGDGEGTPRTIRDLLN